MFLSENKELKKDVITSYSIHYTKLYEENSTLMLLDEAAQLGTLPQLRQAITLLRGYGVRVWSFWQDLSQLINLYPNDVITSYSIHYTKLYEKKILLSLSGRVDNIQYSINFFQFSLEFFRLIYR